MPMIRFTPRRLALTALLPLVGAGGALLLGRGDRVVDVAGGPGPTIGAVHFGGPDRPAGALRDLLLARVRAMPAGSAIDWATYYFLDIDLARALIDASRRGVHVRLVVEGSPRHGGANGAVLDLLRRDGLGGGLTVRAEPPAPFDRLSGKLHAKIYAFSWPRPVALVGSFNPSGNDDDAVQRAIGDQDRGHNMLVEITSPGLVDTLAGHVAMLAAGGGRVGRFGRENNSVWRDRDTALYFFPRLKPGVIEDAIGAIGRGDRVWAAVSHLKGGMVAALAAAAGRGAAIRLIVHDTERRVPQAAVDRLAAQGVAVRRYRHRQGLPMHDKFFVIEAGGTTTSFFGSLNANRNSRLLNDEVLVRSTDGALAEALRRRFGEIEQEDVE